MKETPRDSYKYVFKNITDNTFEESYEESPKDENMFVLKPPTINKIILR